MSWQVEFANAVAGALEEKRAELETLEGSDELRRRWADVAGAARRPAPPQDRLRHVLRVAAAEVPFYADLVREDGEAPSLADFPVMTKRDLRERFPDLLRRSPEDASLPVDRYYLVRTSGSTGVPVTTLKSETEDGRMDAVLRERLYLEYDTPRSGEVFDVGLHSYEAPVVELRLDSRPWIAWNLRPYEADKPEVVAEWDLIVGRRRPVLVQGVTSRVTAVARLSEERRLGLRPALAVCTYEQLTASTRQYVGRVLGCPVVSLYGTTETGIAGWDCPLGTMHLEPDAVLAEIVDEADQPVPPGSAGRLLLTSLKGVAMPIVRYDTGDLARALRRPCPCGRGGLALEALEGRAGLLLAGRTGTQPPYLLGSLVDEAGLVDYQLVQDRPGVVRLVLPEGATVAPDLVARLHAGLRRRNRDDLDIVVEPSGRYVLAPSGKRNTVVSRLSPSAP